MNNEDPKKLKQQAQSHQNKIRNFMLTTNPQIDDFRNSHRKYYEYIVTACGIFAGLTQVLLASNIHKINILAILGFIFFIVAVVTAFLGFRRNLIYEAKFTTALKGIQKILGDFSYEAVKFSKNQITIDDYKDKQDKFEQKYHNMRNNIYMEETDNYENLILKELSDNKFSNINFLTGTFLTGIVFVGLSVLLPQLNGFAQNLEYSVNLIIYHSL